MKHEAEKFTPEQELEAWGAWKEICFVDGCPPAQTAYLRRRLLHKMHRELRGYAAYHDRKGLLCDDELVIEFDLYMAYKDGLTDPKESMPRRNFTQYKDRLWQQMEDSQDPPMQVLNGKLLGPKGMIRDVLRVVLRKHYDLRPESKLGEEMQAGKRFLHRALNLQDRISTEAGQEGSWETLLEADQADPALRSETLQKELQLALEAVLADFEDSHCLLLYANLQQVSLADEAVCEALDCAKSTCYNLFEQAKDKLQVWRRENPRAGGQCDFELFELLTTLLKKRLQDSDQAKIRSFALI
ncbi:MAG: hypothetical protein WCS95_05885 [Lentisphaeria bacterium]|jgi:hypothetical protein|nr:hypothetical protein [Lentisphaeria bacterium]NLZ60968.1 hypothetical protein [Lentisphaerota bacterium]